MRFPDSTIDGRAFFGEDGLEMAPPETDSAWLGGARAPTPRIFVALSLLSAALWSGCSTGAETEPPSSARPSEAPSQEPPEPPVERSPEAAPAGTPEPEAPEPEAPEPEAPEPEAGPGECATDFDCTVIRDSCGRPYARPLDRTEVPDAPSPCPPATYTLVEPSCFDGACETLEVARRELRVCERDADCVVESGPCDDWLVAHRTHAAALRRALDGDVGEIGCPVGRAPLPRPAVACVADVCVARAPR